MLKTKKTHVTDMTEGNALKVIIQFALPLMAANVLQQIFSLTDAMILGIFTGDEGLAVVGTSSWPIWFQVSALTNFGQAACLLAAVRFGAKDGGALKRVVGNIYLASVVIGVVMMLGLQLAAEPLMRIQGTPEEIFDDAMVYLRIMLAGTVFLLIYNMLSSLLRAVGDSVTSFTAITAAAVINVGLDIVLVAGLHMGPAGAAIATIASQAVSALICLVKIRDYREFDMKKEYLKPDRAILVEYTGTCLPMLAQSLVISLGGGFVQSQINQFGTAFAAGVSAAGKIFGVVETAAIALAQASASFVSQNVGAGRFDRIRKETVQVCLFALVMAFGVGAVMILFGRQMLAIYVTEDAIEYAMGDLVVTSVALLLMYPMYVLRQNVQALGNMRIPLIAAVLQLVMRVLTSSLLPMVMGREGIYYATPAAWLVTLILIGIVYPRQFAICRRKREAQLRAA